MGALGVIIIILMLILSTPIIYLLYLKFFSPPSPTTTPKTLKDREAYVIKEIKPENIKGKVKISQSNKIWSASSDEEIERGTKVKINEVEGVHLIVEEIEKKEEKPEDKGFLKSFSGLADSIQEKFSSSRSFLKNNFQNELIDKKDGGLSEVEEPLGPEELEESLEEVVQPEDDEKELTETTEEITEEETSEQQKDEEIEREKVCPSCETLIPSDSKECPKCGTKIKSVQREKLENEIFEVVEKE